MSRRSLACLHLSVSAFALGFSMAAHADPVDFDLAVQPLGPSLREAARQAGLTVAVDGALVADKTAPALKGRYEPIDALRRLLAGSGLAATIEGSNALVTRQTGEIALQPVKVSESKPAPPSGSAAAGYLVTDTTAAGPVWGDMKLQDAPYSMSVVSGELIENLQAYQPEQLVKVIPQITQVNPNQNSGQGNPLFYIRGFAVSQYTNNTGFTYDGLGGVGGVIDTVLEDKERVEFLSGVDGFLYGIGSVGGNLNYVLKRPTAVSYNSITVGSNAGANGYVHGDFGGPIGDKFGYRINVVEQSGDTSITNQNIERDLLSAAFDVRPSDDLLIQFNAAHADYHVNGLTPGFVTSGAAAGLYNRPPDPAKVSSPSWTQQSDRSDNVGANVTWTPNDIVTIRAAYGFTDELTPEGLGTTYRWSSPNEIGTSSAAVANQNVPTRRDTNSVYLFSDTKFSTFAVDHKLTVGFTGWTTDYTSGSPAVSLSGATSVPCDITTSCNFNEPNVTYTPVKSYVQNRRYVRNYVLGDEIKFGDQWTLLAGATYAGVATDGYSASGVKTSVLSNDAVTPSASLIYKARPWLSTYATYQESLQPGLVVPAQYSPTVPYTNAGETLAPYVGHQEEVGAKATVAEGWLVTAALFNINKAFSYAANNNGASYTYIESGTETHHGLELTATGKVTRDLTVIGGITAFTAKISGDTAQPFLNGTTPTNVSRRSAKIYTEYDLPEVPGLTLIGGAQFNGPFYSNASPAGVGGITAAPAVMDKAYVVGDLGLRYAAEIYGAPTTFRFNVYNVTNEAYWQTSVYEGAPRTFLGTVQVKF